MNVDDPGMTKSLRSPGDPRTRSTDESGMRTSRRVFLGGLTATGVLGSSMRVAADDESEDIETFGYGEGAYGEDVYGGTLAVGPDVRVQLDGRESTIVDQEIVYDVMVQNDGDDTPEDVQLAFTFDRDDEIAQSDLDVEYRDSDDGGWETLELSDGDGLTGTYPDDGFPLSDGETRTVELRIVFRKADNFSIVISVKRVDEEEDNYADTDHAVTVESPSEEIELQIDIKPGEDDDEPAPINPNARGRTSIAILTTDEFDPIERLDVDSLRFGPPGVVEEGGGAEAVQYTEEDVDDDGKPDLKVHFDSEEAGFDEGDGYGKVVGQTMEGTPTIGKAEIRIVGNGGRGEGRGGGRGNN